MVTALHACIVRVRRTDKRVVGAGFLVAPDQVATCAHVVREALGLSKGDEPPMGATLLLDLPLLDGAPTAAAQFKWWDPAVDLAVLSVSPVPGAGTAPVVRTADLAEHPFTAFGFPTGFDEGVYAAGTVRGLRAGGRYHLQAEDPHGFRVEGGFSGGPVWDKRLNAVVGMVVSSAEGQGADVRRSAFMVPFDQWVKARPEWAPLAPEVGSAEDAVRAAEEKYLRDLAGEYLYLKFRGIEQAEKWQSLPLDQVFIDLKAFPETDGDSNSGGVAPPQRPGGLQNSVAVDPASLSQTGNDARQRLEAARPEDRAALAEELLVEELRHGTRKNESAKAVPVAQVLIEPGAIVVLGGPGSGKTTLVKRIARSFALGRTEAQKRYPGLPWCFPVAVAAAVFASSRTGRTLLTFLRDKIKAAGGPSLLTAFERHWGAKRCIVLIDGLDEIADAGDRVACAGEVDKFLAECEGNRVVVSSRPVGYRLCRLAAPAEIRLTHIQLAPLSPEDVEAFAHRWYEAYEQTAHREHPNLVQAGIDAGALVAEIRGNPQVADLARNPLMLTIVALIKHQRITLPDRRVRLYETVLDTLINSWNMARNLEGMTLGVELSLEETKKVWGAVAHWMHTQNTGTVTRIRLLEQLVKVIAGWTGDEFGATQAAGGYLRIASEGVGLLEARGPNAFAFLHQTFQEYLAAFHLARNSSTAVQEIVAVCHDPRWHEVVRLAAGYIGVIRNDESVTQLVSALAAHTAGPLGAYLFTGLRVAANCLTDDVGASPIAAARVLQALCLGYQQTTCLPVRDALGKALGRLKTLTPATSTVGELTYLLTTEDWQIRMHSARFLGRLLPRSPELVALFWARLREDRDLDVRAWLAWGLFESHTGLEGATAEVLSALGWALQSTLTRNLRELLATQKTRLLRILVQAESTVVRFSAAQVLGERQEHAVSALVVLLADPDSSMRRQAAEVLGGWGLQEQAVPALVALLADPNPDVRFQAAEVLGGWGLQEQAVPALVALLADPNPDVRFQAAEVLSGWGRQEQAVPALVALLADPDSSMRRQAAQVLGERQEQAVRALVALLADPDSSMRRQAAQVLGGWGRQEQAVPVLVALLADPDPSVRRQAAQVLGRWGRQEQAVPVLVALLADPNPSARRQAAQVLGRWGEREQAVRALVALLADPNPSVRRQAAQVLGGWGRQEQAVPALVALLADPNPSVRLSVAQVLTRWGAATVFHSVLPQLVPTDGAELATQLASGELGHRLPIAPELAQRLANVIQPEPDDTVQTRAMRDLLLAAVWEVTVGDEG